MDHVNRTVDPGNSTTNPENSTLGPESRITGPENRAMEHINLIEQIGSKQYEQRAMDPGNRISGSENRASGSENSPTDPESRTTGPGNRTLEHINLIEQIGSGQYGSVFKAYDENLNSKVAVKIIPFLDNGEGFASSYREIESSKALPEHENIVSVKYSLQATVSSGIASVLVFDLMEQDLELYLRGPTSSMNNSTIKHLMRQLLAAINHCHQNGIMHRDIKPENLLIDTEMTLKLSDFGLAYPVGVNNAMDTNVVSLFYRAPELLLGCTSYTGKIDVWAAGCVFAEMIAGRVMFPGENEVDQLLQIFAALGTPTEQTWAGIGELPVNIAGMYPTFLAQEFNEDLQRIGSNGLHLLGRMLLMNPSVRISAADALNDEYFK